jgi:TolB protein
LVSVSSGERQSNGGSYVPYISPEGRYVAFSSDASNLVRGDTNGARDVFVRDTRRGRTVRASVGYRGQARGGGSEGPGSFGGSLSTHGRHVAYWSNASNLVPRDTNHVTDVFVTRVPSRGGQLPH